MNSNKTKKSSNNKISLKLSKKNKKNKINKKGCCSSSSSSSSNCSSSSSSCSDDIWSNCTDSHYKSCSISSSGCSSNSSSSSCENKKVKTLKLGNKYVTIANDTPTLSFDPSQCNSLAAPSYPMGISVANLISGSDTNQAMLLGSNQSSTPYILVEPRYLGSNLITPNNYLIFPPVDLANVNADFNGKLTVSNDQATFGALDGSVLVSGTVSSLGFSGFAALTTTKTQTAIFGPRSLFLRTTNTTTIDLSQASPFSYTASDMLNVLYFTNTTAGISSAKTLNITIPIMGNGEYKILDLVFDSLITANSLTINVTGSTGGTITSQVTNIFRPTAIGTPNQIVYTSANHQRSFYSEIRCVYISTTAYYTVNNL